MSHDTSKCLECGKGHETDADFQTGFCAAHRPRMGTVVGEMGRFQVVRCDDGEVMHLAFGMDAARGATTGDRVSLTYHATRSMGLWYAKLEKSSAPVDSYLTTDGERLPDADYNLAEAEEE